MKNNGNLNSFIEGLKVIAASLIGLYGLYLGVPLLEEGFNLFKDKNNIANVLPGILVVSLSLLVALNTLSTQNKSLLFMNNKNKKPQDKMRFNGTNIIVSMMFILGIVLAVVYIVYIEKQ